MESNNNLSLVDLPFPIIDIILSLLPLRDLVRSSVLCKPLRYRWHSLPSLTLNSDPTNPLRSPLSSSIIDQILLLHSQSPLHSLAITCSHAHLNSDRWILHLSLTSRSTLSDLTLVFIDRHMHFHPLHSGFYTFDSIKKLSLRHCMVAPPVDFAGFGKMVEMELRDVQVREHGHLQRMLVCGAPKVERMGLVYVRPWRVVRTPYAVRGETEDDLADRFRSAVCTGLVCLHDVVVKESVDYGGLKSLSLVVDLLDVRHMTLFFRVLWSACNLHELSLTGLDYQDEAPENAEEFWKKQAKLDVFSSLRTVEIHDVFFRKFEMEFLFLILTKAPLLEKMIVSCPNRIDRRHDALEELKLFNKASPNAEIIFKRQG